VAENSQDPALPDAAPPLIARFEMAITAADLERLYRYIPGGENAKFDGSSATLETPDSGWRMRISNPRIRSLGLLSLPLASVEIEAWGCSKDEFDRLVERILLVFRRGGG
jgi:hypothetical protein